MDVKWYTLQMVTIRRPEWPYWSDEINFRMKYIMRDKENTFHSDNSSVHQEDVTIINVCVPLESFKIHQAISDKSKCQNRSWRHKM